MNFDVDVADSMQAGSEQLSPIVGGREGGRAQCEGRLVRPHCRPRRSVLIAFFIVAFIHSFQLLSN